MAKNSIRDFDNTSGNNTDIQSVDISEGCSPAGINNAIREMMADLADVNDGTVALTSPSADSLTTDTISEKTADNGVSIDGTNIKDNAVKPADASGTDTAGTALTIKGGAGTGTGAGGSIVFQTADGAGSTGSSVNAHATQVAITDDGNVGVGVATPTKTLEVRGQGLVSGDGNYRATNSGAFNVSPNGNLAIGIGGDSDADYYAMIFHNSSNSPVGSIFCNASSTTYATSSDHRLKENVVDLTGAIGRVKTLAPKRFNFIADPDTTVDGFLAHEVTAVPEAIVGTHNQVDDDGNPVYQGIDQAKLVPVLTAALQEAIAKIETLETKVAALEAE